MSWNQLYAPLSFVSFYLNKWFLHRSSFVSFFSLVWVHCSFVHRLGVALFAFRLVAVFVWFKLTYQLQLITDSNSINDLDINVTDVETWIFWSFLICFFEKFEPQNTSNSNYVWCRIWMHGGCLCVCSLIEWDFDSNIKNPQKWEKCSSLRVLWTNKSLKKQWSQYYFGLFEKGLLCPFFLIRTFLLKD